jgi:RND family efflux transporter MFP subunit
LDFKVTSDSEALVRPAKRRHHWANFLGAAFAFALVGGGAAYWQREHSIIGKPASQSVPPPFPVIVSTPVVRDVGNQLKFWGQFSAINRVEIRAQVGGILAAINFTDGEIVREGATLFQIDRRPFELALRQAAAAVASAKAQLSLADAEVARAQQLIRNNYASAETVDQRRASQQAAAATLEAANETVADAQLNLDYCNVKAPFTGKMRNHYISIGNLVSGSRAGTSSTTLLTTIVSLDPIHLDFKMREAEYLDFKKTQKSSVDHGSVAFRLTGENNYKREGVLDFVDNVISEETGTIHVRATVKNPDLSLVPGQFAYIRLTTLVAHDALLIPDSAITLDQSEHLVMTVAQDGKVVPKQVVIGESQGGLRVIEKGLSAEDRVVVNGLAHALPGSKVNPQLEPLTFDPSKT